MLKQKSKNNRLLKYSTKLPVLLVVAVVALAAITIPLVEADRFDDQINRLRSLNNKTQDKVDALELQAESLESAIAKLQARINGLQRQIQKNQAKSRDLKQKIAKAEIELEKQKDLLGKNIKAMYLEGQISTLEMLATSNDLSEFVDKQQYREVVKSKIKAQVDKITGLRLQLKQQRERVEQLIREDKELKAEIAAQKATQNRLLSMNEREQAKFNASIRTNNKKIEELRRQQVIENIRLFGGSGGTIGGGGYPWGSAPCLGTGRVDGWCPGYEWGYNGSYYNWSTGGYAYRNCTDWVSYRVRSTGRHVPGGLGNANSWDDRAPSYGFTVSSTPRVGAAAVSNYGFYGHVMYVEAVNNDGSIIVSDYNRAGTGKYDMSTINPSGLRFVYF